MPKLKLSGVEENVLLAPYTTFKIGGPAKYFCIARSADEMVRAVRAAVENGVRFFVLAGGSNILVSDEGFDGLVILNEIREFRAEIQDGRAVVTAGAGESWDEIVARCVVKDFAGIECLSGIPGKVGSAPVQNIGAYGQSVGEVVESVEAVDSQSGERLTFNKTQCEFEYRTSIFKKMQGRYIITQITFALKPSGAPLIVYHDLQEYFMVHNPSLRRLADPLILRGGDGGLPSLAEVRRAVIEIRAKKGYVIMPEYECYKTAGSFFMNPIIAPEQFQKLQTVISGCADPWYWRLENGAVKVSAACLLQNAGFSKGYRRGDVGISPKHALSLVNFGNATAREVVAFADEIKARVQEKFNIKLEEEVQFIGF